MINEKILVTLSHSFTKHLQIRLASLHCPSMGPTFMPEKKHRRHFKFLREQIEYFKIFQLTQTTLHLNSVFQKAYSYLKNHISPHDFKNSKNTFSTGKCSQNHLLFMFFWEHFRMFNNLFTTYSPIWFHQSSVLNNALHKTLQA